MTHSMPRFCRFHGVVSSASIVSIGPFFGEFVLNNLLALHVLVHVCMSFATFGHARLPDVSSDRLSLIMVGPCHNPFSCDFGITILLYTSATSAFLFWPFSSCYLAMSLGLNGCSLCRGSSPVARHSVSVSGSLFAVISPIITSICVGNMRYSV
jgi:hypothetical protein